MKKHFLPLFFLISFSMFAQLEVRYANGKDANPRWIQLMYSDTPDLGKVTEAYTKYYQTHTFVKNKSVHTGCQMINIDSQWDTSLWDYFKLTKLATWINILDNDISEYHKYNHHIIGFPIEEVDLFFAKAMGFEFLDNV